VRFANIGRGGVLMTIAGGILAVLTFFNVLLFWDYVPRIAKKAKDQSDAEKIPFSASALCLASYTSAIAYAIGYQGDWKTAFLFAGNAVGCGVVLLVVAWKRSRHRDTDAV
jgi:hypothetical protein